MLEVHYSHEVHSYGVLSTEGSNGVCFLGRHGAYNGFTHQHHSFGATGSLLEC